MESQKMDTQLLLALNTSEAEREKTEDLNVGFDRQERTWEVIVKYHGSLENLGIPGVDAEELIAGYGILTIPESRVDEVSRLAQIEYMEKPKRLFFADLQNADDSCILPVAVRQPFLRGRGVLIAVIDSGIDYRNPNFLTADGESRILYLYDQVQEKEFTGEEINRALKEGTGVPLGSDGKNREGVPGMDTSGHGTAVAAIAAGKSAEYEGVAPESELLVVKLGYAAKDSFPRTTQLIRALTYVVKKALSLKRPLAVNLSFGNTYGPHDGTSLLERFIDNVAEIGRSVICVGAGNEGYSMGHVQGNGSKRILLSVGNYESSLSVQFWSLIKGDYRLQLIAPSGEILEITPRNEGKKEWVVEGCLVLVYVGEPTPYRMASEIYFDFLPLNDYLSFGEWIFQITYTERAYGNYSFYLPSLSIRGGRTYFLEPVSDGTITIPATARRVLSVGAYDATYGSYADFSGRGAGDSYGNLGNGIKPDLVAPGVGIIAPDVYGGYGSFTGTSFATPFVTGAAALLMEWGIVRGNDPFLYGEKVKAYLRRGAKPISGEQNYPNNRVGFGALCVADSLPI